MKYTCNKIETYFFFLFLHKSIRQLNNRRMPLVQNLETREVYQVSTRLIEGSEVLKLMLQDTTPEDADEPIPLCVDTRTIKALDHITEKLQSLVFNEKVVKGFKTNLLDFIENHYEVFITSYVHVNFPNLPFTEDLDKIVDSVSVEDVIASLYATNFLDCPVIIRGVAFLLGYMITKTSYDTKFRIFNAIRYRLGHLTSKNQLYVPVEPIEKEKGWLRFVDLMEPERLAIPIDVIEIINYTASYKVNDQFIKELEIDILMKFMSEKRFLPKYMRVIYGECNGVKCFNNRWVKLNDDSYSESESDGEFRDEYEEDEYEDDDYILKQEKKRARENIKIQLELEKRAMIENISFLETSRITCLRYVFKNCDLFNLPLLWNVSNVVDFHETFSGATIFNQPLNWNTKSAKNMTLMFNRAKNFNQPLYWDTSNVFKMSAMFFRAINFNSPIEFDTRNLEFSDSMFAEVPNFNHPLNFDTSNLLCCDSMFRGAKEFNQPVDWTTPKLLKLSNVFDGATKFNQKVPWNTEKVDNFVSVFRDAECFNQPVEWDFSKATIMNNMFRGAKAFNHPIKSASPELISIDCMFSRAVSFNSVIDLDTSKVSMMKEVFRGATAFNQSLDSWRFDKAYCMHNMFLEANSFSHKLPFDHTQVRFPCDLFN